MRTKQDSHLASGLQVHDGGCVRDQFLRVPLRRELHRSKISMSAMDLRR
jgi:hypothetical protein